MKIGLAVLAALGLFATPITAQAGETAVVLSVHHAGCVLCGPIVKSTLAHIKGVSGVRVSQADGNADVVATVNYDAAVTSPDAMIKATTNQGYPAEVAAATKG